MNEREFYGKVTSHVDPDGEPDLDWLGCRAAGEPDPSRSAADVAEVADVRELVKTDEVYVRHAPTGFTVALPLSEISRHDWEDLEAVLTTRREACVLGHLSRIVGYFSAVRGWNRSKQAELADRHAAREHYRVPAGEVAERELRLP